MCGIVGIFDRNLDKNEINKTINSLNTLQNHRGPDENNVYIDQDISFAMGSTRLAILDIKYGSQPLISSDGRYSLVYNGEIYNAPELRINLINKGIHFVTANSDTEVLFNKLIYEGIESISEVNGMFAFAFYDSYEKKLILSRDRVGIKPLYFYNKNNCFLFASEIRTIISHRNFSKELNLQSLFHYTSLMYIPNEETIYKNINKIDPGSFLIIDLKDNIQKKNYWFDLDFNIDNNKSREFWLEKTNDVVKKSIKNSTISDVPFATLLSSGVDSSIIVNCLKQINNIELNTHTLGFDNNSEYESINELDTASTFAKELKSNHTSMIYNENIFREELLNMVLSMGEPYGGGLPSWAIFKSISSKFKMALSGTGADEIFGSYGKWKRLLPLQFVGKKTNKYWFNKNLFEHRYYLTDKIKKNKIFNNNFSNCFQTSDLMFDIFNSCNDVDVRNQSAYLDFKTQLPNEFLLMTDHFSMAHSLEIRPPYLDNAMINLFLTMPPKFRTSFFDLKKMLKDSFNKEINNNVFKLQKKGFVLPIKKWIKSNLLHEIKTMFEPQRLKKQDIFNTNLLEEYILPTINDDKKNITSVWGLYMFQLWYDNINL